MAEQLSMKQKVNVQILGNDSETDVLCMGLFHLAARNQKLCCSLDKNHILGYKDHREKADHSEVQILGTLC